MMSIGTVDSPFPTSMTFTPSKCWVALTRVRLTPVPELSHAVTVTVALACTESVALLAERVAVFGYVPALEASVAELTWTVALAPGERLPKAQESVCDGTEPLIEHVPGPLYAGLIDHDTPVPPGSGSSSDTAVAVAVPAAALLLAVTVNPIGEPVVTVDASAVLVIDKAGACAGITVKLPLLVAVPPSVVTLTAPLVAPTGTFA